MAIYDRISRWKQNIFVDVLIDLKRLKYSIYLSLLLQTTTTTTKKKQKANKNAEVLFIYKTEIVI